MLGNRSDLTTRIYNWIWDSYLELGMSLPFEGLEKTLSATSTPLTPTIVAGTDNYAYPTGVRAVKIITMLLTTGTSRLRRKNLEDIEDFSTAAADYGQPSIYSPFENKIWLRAVPDVVYSWRWRVWMAPTQGATVDATILLVPDDWLEVVDWGAAMRGFVELLEPDKSANIRMLLFGSDDPRTGHHVPGLIEKKMTRAQAEVESREFGFKPKVRSYT
jgi:hypothetical protein